MDEPAASPRSRPRVRRISRRWIIVGVLLVAVLGYVRLLDRSTPIFYYRVVDDRTLAVGTVTGPGTWTRVTLVTESATSIWVGVSSLRAPLPGAGGDSIELVVPLREPLGDRHVNDASSGQWVDRRDHCLAPAERCVGAAGGSSQRRLAVAGVSRL